MFFLSWFLLLISQYFQDMSESFSEEKNNKMIKFIENFSKLYLIITILLLFKNLVLIILYFNSLKVQITIKVIFYILYYIFLLFFILYNLFIKKCDIHTVSSYMISVILFSFLPFLKQAFFVCFLSAIFFLLLSIFSYFYYRLIQIIVVFFVSKKSYKIL